MRSRWVSMAVVMGVAVTLAFAGTTSAQKTKGKTRASQTKYLMRGIMQPNCKGLAGLLKDSGPSDDKTWDAAACNASCLNEMSYLLMDDGRCPDGVWAGAAKGLRENSAAALAAIEKKDLDGTKGRLQEPDRRLRGLPQGPQAEMNVVQQKQPDPFDRFRRVSRLMA